MGSFTFPVYAFLLLCQINSAVSLRVLKEAKRMSFEEYLEFEKTTEIRHEFVDGFVFAMAGATDTHNRLTGIIFSRAYLAVLETQCMVYKENMKLQTPASVGYYPDVFAVCDPNDVNAPVKRTSCFIVEVLSKFTEDIDRGEKWLRYQTIPSLQSYVLVSQKTRRLEVFKRQHDSSWRYEFLEEGKLELPCINLSITLDEIYERVIFTEED
jgi:Uma2 family endonuclease